MTKFIPLDQSVLLKMLEGHTDILTPLAKKELDSVKSASCPECGSEGEPFIDPSKPFVKGSPLPYRSVRCLNCRTEFDPTSKAILRAGQFNPLP